MTDSEHEKIGRVLNCTVDDIGAVQALLDACEKYPAVYKVVLEALGPRTFKRDFTLTMIPTIRDVMLQEQSSSMAELQEFRQAYHTPQDLDFIRQFKHVSDDAKWLVGFIVNDRVTYESQNGSRTWGRSQIMEAIGKERVKAGMNELKVVLRGGI